MCVCVIVRERPLFTQCLLRRELPLGMWRRLWSKYQTDLTESPPEAHKTSSTRTKTNQTYTGAFVCHNTKTKIDTCSDSKFTTDHFIIQKLHVHNCSNVWGQ